MDPIERIVIGDSGHFMMNDKPDEFYSRLGTLIISKLAQAFQFNTR